MAKIPLKFLDPDHETDLHRNRTVCYYSETYHPSKAFHKNFSTTSWVISKICWASPFSCLGSNCKVFWVRLSVYLRFSSELLLSISILPVATVSTLRDLSKRRCISPIRHTGGQTQPTADENLLSSLKWISFVIKRIWTKQVKCIETWQGQKGSKLPWHQSHSQHRRGDWKCGSGKCDTGKIATVENAGVESAGVDRRGGICRSKPYGTPTRDYIETALSHFVILVLILLTE